MSPTSLRKLLQTTEAPMSPTNLRKLLQATTVNSNGSEEEEEEGEEMKWKCSDLKCVQKPTRVGLV